MKNHIKVYLSFFNYGQDDYKPCEYCLLEKGLYNRAVDVHHIEPRGMGGSKQKDHIEWLVGLCRRHHNQSEDKIIIKAKLLSLHARFIMIHDPNYKFEKLDDTIINQAKNIQIKRQIIEFLS